MSGGRLWFRRRALPHRPTYNVVAEAGDPHAERTVVFLAHHDAAHSGLVFHPALPRVAMERMPELHAKADQSVPIIYGVFLGPLLLALWGLTGRRLLRVLGTCFAAGATAAMADIGAQRGGAGRQRQPQRGGVLVALAHVARANPPARRARAAALDRLRGVVHGGDAGLRPPPLRRPRRATRTEFVCLECVGSPQLCVVEGEGMLRMRRYTRELARGAGARGRGRRRRRCAAACARWPPRTA